MRRSAERQGNKGSRNELVASPLLVRRRICAAPAGLGIVVHRGSCLPGAMSQKGCEFGICQSWVRCGSNFGTFGVALRLCCEVPVGQWSYRVTLTFLLWQCRFLIPASVGCFSFAPRCRRELFSVGESRAAGTCGILDNWTSVRAVSYGFHGLHLVVHCMRVWVPLFFPLACVLLSWVLCLVAVPLCNFRVFCFAPACFLLVDIFRWIHFCAVLTCRAPNWDHSQLWRMFHNAELVCEASGGAGACGAFKMPELQIVLLGLVTFLYGFELLSLVTFSYGHVTFLYGCLASSLSPMAMSCLASSLSPMAIELLGLVTFLYGHVLLGLDNLILRFFNNDCMIAVTAFAAPLYVLSSFCLLEIRVVRGFFSLCLTCTVP